MLYVRRLTLDGMIGDAFPLQLNDHTTNLVPTLTHNPTAQSLGKPAVAVVVPGA